MGLLPTNRILLKRLLLKTGLLLEVPGRERGFVGGGSGRERFFVIALLLLLLFFCDGCVAAADGEAVLCVMCMLCTYVICKCV